MTDELDIQKALLSVGRNGPKAKQWGDLCQLVREHLAQLAPHERLTTRELITELGWDELAHTNQALWRLRKHNGIPHDYYLKDDTKRVYGHPLIQWKAPGGEAIDVSIF